MRLTPLCIEYCLYRPTDSLRCTSGYHVFYPLRRAVFLFLFFGGREGRFSLLFFSPDSKFFGYGTLVTDFRDSRSLFSAERRQSPKQNSTLSVCEICHGGHLGFPIGTIFAIFDLQVILMLPSKFGVNWPFCSGEEAKNRFSRWPPWRPSWISDRHDFSYF